MLSSTVVQGSTVHVRFLVLPAEFDVEPGDADGEGLKYIHLYRECILI